MRITKPSATYVRGRRHCFDISVRRSGDHQTVSSPSSPRNASSSRWRDCHRVDRDPGARRARPRGRRAWRRRGRPRAPGARVTTVGHRAARQHRVARSGSSTSRYADVEACDQVGDRARGDEPAALHDDGVAAHLLDLRQEVTRQQHGHAAVGEAAEQVADLAHLAGVETVGRLVEHEHLGRAEQRARTPSRWRMPCEYVLTLRFTALPRPGDRERLVEVRRRRSRRRRPPSTDRRFTIPER